MKTGLINDIDDLKIEFVKKHWW